MGGDGGCPPASVPSEDMQRTEAEGGELVATQGLGGASDQTRTPRYIRPADRLGVISQHKQALCIPWDLLLLKTMLLFFNIRNSNLPEHSLF